MSVSDNNLKRMDRNKDQRLHAEEPLVSEKLMHARFGESVGNRFEQKGVFEGVFEAKLQEKRLPGTLPFSEDLDLAGYGELGKVTRQSSEEAGIPTSDIEILEYLGKILLSSGIKSPNGAKFITANTSFASSSSSAFSNKVTERQSDKDDNKGVSSTESKLEKEHKIRLLSEIHAIIAAKDNLSVPEQNASVAKISELYTRANISVDLSEAFLHHPPLLVTAAHKSNWAAMKWLLDAGANISREQEMVFYFSAPEIYSQFKEMMKQRRSANAQFVSFCVTRHRELSQQWRTEEEQRLLSEKAAEKALVAAIEKQAATIKEKVQTKYFVLVTESCTNSALLKQLKMSPRILNNIFEDIYKYSFLHSIGIFSAFSGACQTPHPCVTYIYFLGTTTKEAIQIELEKALQALPESLREKVRSILRFEKTCFDLVFQKIKSHLEKFKKDELTAFEQYIPKTVMQLFGDPKKASELKKHLEQINLKYLQEIEAVVIPNVVKKIEGLIDQALAQYPEEQLKARTRLKGVPRDLVEDCQSKRILTKTSTDSMEWFHAVHGITQKSCLGYLEFSFGCHYKVLQEGLVKFKSKPTQREIEVAYEEMCKDSELLGKSLAALYNPLAQASAPAAAAKKGALVGQTKASARQDTDTKEPADKKAQAMRDAKKQQDFESDKLARIKKDRLGILNAYQRLTLDERDLFKQLLSPETDLGKLKNPEDNILKLLTKLGVKNLSTVSLTPEKLLSKKGNLGVLSQFLTEFRSAMLTLNIAENDADIFLADCALLKQYQEKNHPSNQQQEKARSLASLLSLQ